MICTENESVEKEKAKDLLAEARVAHSVVTSALYAFATSSEDDVLLSKDAAYGLWKLNVESAEKTALACGLLGLAPECGAA